MHYGVPYQWGPNVLMYNTEVFPEPPTSWSVVFEEQTLPDGQSNKGRVQAYDGPIYIADAAQYLMAHKPELGITNPYELNEEQYAAALDLLRAQRELVGRYWHDAMIQIDDFKNEGVVASGSWPFQVNLLKADGRAGRLDDPRGGRDGLGRHPDAARRRRAPELRLQVHGALAVARTSSRDLSVWFGSNPAVPAACTDGSGHADQGGLHGERLRRLRPHPVLDDAGRGLLAGRGGLRALLPLGVGLHRGDRRALRPPRAPTTHPTGASGARPIAVARAPDG